MRLCSSHSSLWCVGGWSFLSLSKFGLLCMYACMYVCMYVFMYVYVCMYRQQDYINDHISNSSNTDVLVIRFVMSLSAMHLGDRVYQSNWKVGKFRLGVEVQMVMLILAVESWVLVNMNGPRKLSSHLVGVHFGQWRQFGVQYRYSPAMNPDHWVWLESQVCTG